MNRRSLLKSTGWLLCIAAGPPLAVGTIAGLSKALDNGLPKHWELDYFPFDIALYTECSGQVTIEQWEKLTGKKFRGKDEHLLYYRDGQPFYKMKVPDTEVNRSVRERKIKKLKEQGKW